MNIQIATLSGLPGKFDIIVADLSLAVLDRDTLSAARASWLAAKSELKRRNYTILEYRDEERRRFVATCIKRPHHG